MKASAAIILSSWATLIPMERITPYCRVRDATLAFMLLKMLNTVMSAMISRNP